MNKTTAKTDERRMISESKSALDQLIREGARKMLQAALNKEVADPTFAIIPGDVI